MQGAWGSKTPNPRVVYDIVSLEHVQWLRDHPPTIDGRTYYASQYHFVQPLFAFELTVVRCREFQSTCSTIDSYIRRRYGDVITHRRMALGRDLYCVVFKHWETADCFLWDLFDAFDSAEGSYGRNFAPVGPYLLYLVNSMGVPHDPSYLGGAGPASESQSAEVKNMQAQMEDIRVQGASAMNSFHAVLHEFRGVINHLISQSNQTTSALGSLAASMIASNNVTHISSHVQSLRMEQNSLQLTTLLSPSLNDFARQQLAHQVSDVSLQLATAQRQLDDALTHSTALDHALMPTIASLTPIPVPTLVSASSNMGSTITVSPTPVHLSPPAFASAVSMQAVPRTPLLQTSEGGTRTSADHMEGSDMEESDSEEVHLPAPLASCALMASTALMERSSQQHAIMHGLPASLVSRHQLSMSLFPSHHFSIHVSVLTLFVLVFFVSLLPYTHASSAPSTLRAFAINSNGLVDPMK